jgi:hypothetical protein
VSIEGHAVKRLATHADEKVSQLAKQVIQNWKSHFEAKLSRPTLDVQCDRKTESVRHTARKHIASALMTDESTDEQVRLFLSCRVIIKKSENSSTLLQSAIILWFSSRDIQMILGSRICHHLDTCHIDTYLVIAAVSGTSVAPQLETRKFFQFNSIIL